MRANIESTESVVDRATAPDTAPRKPPVEMRSRRNSPGPSPRELRPGDVLENRYTLLSPLGEGGMGDVWLAYNATLDVRVALKVLRLDGSRPDVRAKMTQRLLQEARAAAKLIHPAIVRIIDFGEVPSGNAYYVMELLDGEDLHSLLETHGRLSAVKAVRMLLPIASALVAAHGKNIVHRDLKPENIFLARDTDQRTVQPKLIDFGVAKLKAVNERLTIAGSVVGSPGYMAPEQARGEDVDERADVWGFCVVLYEAMTGRLPFEGKNYNALMRSIIEDAPCPIMRCGVGDEMLWSIIERGLAKNPDMRWQTMRDLGGELARWLLHRSVTEDICGTQLATAWMRERSYSGISSNNPPDDPSDASKPDPERSARAELPTEPPPFEDALDTASPSTAPTPRSRRGAVAAVLTGFILTVVIGIAALGRSNEAAPVEGSTKGSAAAGATALPSEANLAPAMPAAPAEAASSRRAEDSASATRSASRGTRTKTKAGSQGTSPARATATPTLKNPF